MDINKPYEIEFTDECKREIRKIYDYIKNNLYAGNAAKGIMNKLEKVINNLIYTPYLYVELNKYKGTKRIYRRIVINDYILLYTIDEKRKKCI